MMLSFPCLIFFLVPAILGSPCDTKPLSLSIEDVQVRPDIRDSFMRGIPAKIGSPAQDIVLLPWAELNNTWVYDEQAYCDKSIIWNDRICEIRRGGLFNEDDSETFRKTSDIEATGGAATESSFEGSEKGIGRLLSTALTGTDSLDVNGGGLLKGFPIGIPRQRWDAGYTMLHALGMGSNSTYLNALVEAGKIGSRVWSIFWGRMWIDRPINGSLVLGGYDEEKVIGKNYTAPLDFSDFTGTSGCWTGMKVTISNIKVNFRDGSDESIIPSNTALPCCIVPQRQLLLEAPGSIVENFEAATKTKHTEDSFGLHWSAKMFDADDAFDGDITISLSSGLDIRVPNDQYMTPFVDVHRNGSRTLRRDRRELHINALSNQPATLGRYFLTAAYLMVNHDSKTFTLWQANPSSRSSLVRVFDEKTAAKCDTAKGVVQPSATISPGAAAPESAEEEEEEETDNGEKKSSGAVIGGAVAGAVVGLGLAACVIYHALKRRQQHASIVVPSTGGETPNIGKGEVDLIRQEMMGQNHYVYEMDGDVYHPDRSGR